MKYTPSLFLLLMGMFFTMSAAGQTWQWGRNNTGDEIDGWGVATDQYGDVFVAGDRSGLAPAVFGTYTVPFSGGNAGFQSIVAKYNADGVFQWARGNDKGTTKLINIAADPAGDVFMFGAFDTGLFQIQSFTLANTNHQGVYEYFLVKINSLGNVVWATSAGNTQSFFVNIGPFFTLLGLGAVAADASGNVYITANFSMPSITIGGTTLTNADASGKTDDIFLAKYDPNGIVQWATSVGGSKSDDAYALTVTPGGDIYMAGDLASPAVNFGPSVITNAASAQVAFIARFNSSGGASWACASGGTGKEFASGLAADANSNVYLTGGFSDPSISFNGTTIANPYPGQAVMYLTKFDPNNNVSWYKTVGSPVGGDVWGYSVATSNCGYVWVCGEMPYVVHNGSGTVPGQVSLDGNVYNTSPSSYDPIFIAGYTQAGAYADCQTLQCGGDDEDDIVCDPSGNVFVCSDFKASWPFAIGNINFQVDSQPSEFMYVAKYSPPNTNATVKLTDTTMCYTPGITVYAPEGYASYTWSDGKKGTSHAVTDTGVVWVRGDDTCGVYTVDTFRVSNSCNCVKYLFVPNSFTPNGDGQNDLFYPRSSHGETKIRSFRVYNRWGELMFERENLLANDASNAWDGSYQGNLPLPDVYVYVVEAVCLDGTVVNKRGSVTVIR